MNTLNHYFLTQYLLKQTEVHQQLLQNCPLQLANRTLTITCQQKEEVEAIKQAIPLLSEGLEAIADRLVIYLNYSMTYYCSIQVAQEKREATLSLLRQQLDQQFL